MPHELSCERAVSRLSTSRDDDGIVVACTTSTSSAAPTHLYIGEIGETPDVAARVLKHNEGGCRHTAKRRPVTLEYSEPFANRL
jgi:hypothetical protein